MPRKAHVKRIYSESKASWVDVLRIDEFYVSGSTMGNTMGKVVG